MTVDEAAIRRLVIALLVVGGTATLPALVAGRPANEIPVADLARDEAAELDSPTAAGWSQTPAATIPLASAPSTVPNANDTSIEEMRVRAAHSDQRLYVKLSWNDSTKDGNVTPSRYEAPRVGSFADGVAVQFPVNRSEQPSIAMGSPRSLVNVWYWNPEMGSQTLLAGGPGTTTQVGNSTLRTNATYRDGSWHVVMSRALQSTDANRTDLELDRNLNVAFGVWNGSNEERSGQKAVSEWYHFPFGEGPSGPPYETVLWTVAGLMITVVLVVTAMAVRRGGG